MMPAKAALRSRLSRPKREFDDSRVLYLLLGENILLVPDDLPNNGCVTEWLYSNYDQ